MQRTDVLIVGAGPIGLELAVSLKHAGVDYVQLDAGQVGQTIGWYPRQARFFSSPERIAIAGVPLVTSDQSKATREEYLAYLRGVAQQFDLPVHTFERVVSLRREEDGFIVRALHGDDERLYHARNVVLAIGDMHHARMLHVPGEDLPHVSHYFDEPHRYFRQRLLIVGGRNSAVEAALRCHRAGTHVTLSYRRDAFDAGSIKYWLLPELEALIRHGHIRFYPNSEVRRITPTHVTLAPTPEAARLQPLCPTDPTDLPFDFVLLLTGYVQDTALLEQIGVELTGPNRAPTFDPDTMQTNVPGLYVAGTAAAGSQVRFKLFIENCHPHVVRITRALTGRDPDPALVNQAARQFALPES